jgi:hypothetical protein
MYYQTPPTFGRTLMNRALSALAVIALVLPRVCTTQDANADRFGIGVSGIEGSFGGYRAAFPGVEGFFRVAHGSFWSVRVDGAYFGGTPQQVKVCTVSPDDCGDTRVIGRLGTLMGTVALGPTASSGLRPHYGLLGVGGAATRWGGGGCSQDVANCGAGVGFGPALALVEAGVGSEFHALGGNRIELRVHKASRSLLPGGPTSTGASLTMGVVW